MKPQLFNFHLFYCISLTIIQLIKTKEENWSLKTDTFDIFQKFPTLDEYPKATYHYPAIPLNVRKHTNYRETLYSM